MKKDEQQLADELDLFLTAALQGEAASLTPEAQTEEAKLAAELMQLAAANKPEPEFVNELEKRLVKKTAVSPHPKAHAPERLSLWQQMQHFVKEGLTMKRSVYVFGALAAVAVIVLAGLFLFNGRNTTEPGATVADVTDTPTENDTTPVAVADLPKLPALQGSGQAYGLGGGGGVETAAAPRPEASLAADAMMPIFTDIFSGTNFVLNTTLPTEPTMALVQRQDEFVLDEAQVQAMIAQMGFSGPLYEQYNRPFPQGIDAGPVYEIPTIYHAFDGKRALTIDTYGVYYRNEGVAYDFANPLPFEQAAPIAEAFVTDSGWATFPYTMERGWGSDVLFYRLVNGVRLNQPEMSVTVADDGQVAFASYNALTRLQDVGQYPLISAEAAWALIQDGVLANNIIYTWLPTDNDVAVEAVEAPIDAYQYWQRTYQPGDEVHLYSWPSIFLPVDGAGAPRIEVYPYLLAGDTAVLNDIVGTEETMLHIWGTLGDDGRTLQVAGWESVAQPESLFLEGMIRLVDGQVQLLTNERDTYILPNAPADVTDGMDVFVFAWGARDLGAAHPVLDWESIEKRVPPTEADMPVESMPMPVEPMPIDGPGFAGPPPFETVTVDGVSLGYYRLTIFPQVAEGEPVLPETRFTPPPELIVPVWQFVGTTNTGERMEFSVTAVAPDYLESPQP